MMSCFWKEEKWDLCSSMDNDHLLLYLEIYYIVLLYLDIYYTVLIYLECYYIILISLDIYKFVCPNGCCSNFQLLRAICD